ncbi:polyphosphate polymerase domain-containing protein [Fluviicola sp.]|jgi:hypothetical protein|uniref:polyphosphate polymerase domain-containing protein n=1 Tax=Fluviicola sp. TaxID=1917219 RepID=UPI00281C2455|nr:polyphosphate polymerase domain-containing protein [Fluviicola sp.]MDR0803397.1 polyphosphate polymerase domain-containing protein [Fluviicola sp.]
MKGRLTDILLSFRGISLDDLSRAPLMNRVDEKFAFPLNRLEYFLQKMLPYYDVLNLEGKVIFDYTSQYFDNADYTFFQDHHKSIPNRFKVRIRTYLDSNKSYLEVKKRIKGRTDKSRIDIEGFTTTFSEDQLLFLSSQLRKQIELQPVMINNYRRITLVNKTAEERLTIDFDITNGTSRDSSCKQTLSSIAIAELKQPKLDRNSPFYQLMKQEQVRPFRISKFCFGMIDLYDESKLKSNRFKEKKLLIQKLINTSSHASFPPTRS